MTVSSPSPQPVRPVGGTLRGWCWRAVPFLPALVVVGCLVLTGMSGCSRAPVDAAAPMQWTRVFPGSHPGEWFPRALPLTDLPTTRTIDVADFGAKPDDDADDTRAIQAAIDAAKAAAEPTLVQFSPGTYRISAPASSEAQRRSFLLQGLRDAIIDGGGALLLQTDPTQGIFRLEDCERVIVRNFVVDYDPLPFTQGIIRRIHGEPARIDFAMADGFPAPDDSQFRQSPRSNISIPLDPEVPGRLRGGIRNFFLWSGAERQADGLYRVQFVNLNKGWESGLAIGDRFALLARNDIPIASFECCRHVTMRNITTFASPGGQYTGTHNDSINILECKALIKPGRWMGGNADVIHLYGSRGAGPWVEDCEFEGIGDDVVCIYNGRPVFIREVLSPTELVLGSANVVKSPRGAFEPLKDEHIQAGERLAFLDPQSGRLLGEAGVESIDLATGRVVLGQPIETAGLTTGAEKGNTQVYNISIGGNFVVRNNRIANSRRYGMFLKAADGLIEGNRIEGMSASAIHISDEPVWPEGLQAARLLIRNNAIDQCGFDQLFQTDPSQAQITIYSQNIRRQPVLDDPSFHRDIVLDGNKIENWAKLALHLSNIHNLTVKNTEIGPPREMPATLLHKGPLGGTVAVQPFPPDPIANPPARP